MIIPQKNNKNSLVVINYKNTVENKDMISLTCDKLLFNLNILCQLYSNKINLCNKQLYIKYTTKTYNLHYYNTKV